MFHGGAQSTIALVRRFISNLDRILQNNFHLKSSFDKTKYIFDQSILENNGHFDDWFSSIKAFLEFVQGETLSFRFIW